jgi:hypothetical protein
MRPRFGKSLAAALSCGLLAVAAARSQDLHVEGTNVYTGFATNGTTLVTMSWQFILDVSQDKWVVHTVPLTVPPSRRERWREDAGDGTNIYSLMVSGPSTNVPTRSRIPAPQNKSDSGTGRVWQEAVPFPELGQAAPVWFAYVKAASQQAPGKFKPLWYTDLEIFYSPRLCLKAFIQTNTASPYLPQQAWFIAPGKEFDYQFGKVLAFPAEVQNYTNAIYTASNFVTVGPLTVPRSFALDVYAPGGSGPAAFYRYLRYAGTASVISPEVTRKELLPPVTVQTYVNDFRLPVGKLRLKFSREDDDGSPPHLEYVITNSWLTSTNDPRFRNAVLQSQSKRGWVLRF